MFFLKILCSSESEFQKVHTVINKSPKNIEELVALQDYMSNTLPLTSASLHGCVQELMGYADLLDTYHFKNDQTNELYHRKWVNICSQPKRVVVNCAEATENNIHIKKR